MASKKGVIWKRVGAILLGFLTGALLSLGTDQLLAVTGVYPPWGNIPDGLYLVPTAYRFVFNTAGCYIAAHFAPVKPMWHAMFIGWFGFVLATVGAIVTWNTVPKMGPHWYAIVVALMSVPCAWLGGKINQVGAERKS